MKPDLSTTLAQRHFEKEGCQWIGPEQTEYPYKMCGCSVLPKSAYCDTHYRRVYMGGAKGAEKILKSLQKYNT
jgi:hypothetical protein